MKPTAKTVNATLDEIARASGSTPSFQQLAHSAVLDYRARHSPVLTQERIDNGGDGEGRRQRFVASAVKWSRRSWWRRLLGG